MTKILNVLTLIACAAGGIFNVGCTTSQRAQYMAEMQDYVQEKVIPAVTAKAREEAKALVDRYAAAQYGALNESLVTIAPTDPVTKQRVAKVWQDFDLDRSGVLEAKELFTVNTYVWSEGQKRVSEGTITKDEFDDAKKKTGVAGAALAAALAAAWFLKKKEPVPGPLVQKPPPTQPG